MGMGFFFGGLEVLVGLGFLAVFGMMIFMIVRGVGEWNKNNSSPRLTVEAEAVSRRTQTSTSQTPVAGERRPDGVPPQRPGVRHDRGGGQGQAHLSGHPLPEL